MNLFSENLYLTVIAVLFALVLFLSVVVFYQRRVIANDMEIMEEVQKNYDDLLNDVSRS